MPLGTALRDAPGAGPVIVAGAGIGGLAAGLSLAASGREVIVTDRATHPGGKIRRVNGAAAGPTVLTLRWVFEALFETACARLSDRVRLTPLDILARHFWSDGTTLDLHADPEASAAAIRDMAGARGEAQFRAFSDRARRLFDGFLDPVMRAPRPDPAGITRALIRDPGLMRAMAPGTSLDGLLQRSFDDPRLAQLFGRYATYVGGLPHRTPALLSLIWEAEAAGVWAAEGGLTALAQAVADLFSELGGTLRLGTGVREIRTDGAGVIGVALDDGTEIATGTVIFNGDPRALGLGLLGPAVEAAAPQALRRARSLSAEVWSVRGRWHGPDLAHHNVFFRDDPTPEFRALDRGATAPDPTLYLCAEDRGLGQPPCELDRFEIIVNASPLTQTPSERKEFRECRKRTFGHLERFRATISPTPGPDALTTPKDFEALSPGSAGSLYGQSPHGPMAAFSRPTARSAVPGLYLAGGGVHPGPGVPMAALSGMRAAEAITMDRASLSRSRRAGMPGGMSTGSATTAPARSRS
ncbi:amine oxidase [Roseivivax marinus]|uniref:Amine oxidase n=1 Tax=Roseivivax marinus TaxID=1379903 RepID=W4HJB1_9RHOB|nr:1-hydroxycarotenoid 3,4-desaturase CrtD [Roseivivax marinus]ETW12226.1 amine oxidase [Roseivivax marinus]